MIRPCRVKEKSSCIQQPSIIVDVIAKHLEFSGGLVWLSFWKQQCPMTLVHTEEPSDARAHRSIGGPQQNCG